MRDGLKLLRYFLLFLSFHLSIVIYGKEVYYPKREFRGAWIQAVNGQFEGIPTATLKKELINQLDSLYCCGINAIIFQVRVEGDALYNSEIEPWSRYLTGMQGRAPDQEWDPLRFMIKECHNRGMELHAWINPFRAKTKTTVQFAPNHQYMLYPERFVRFGDLTLFNPALQENRDFICSIVEDIVLRYDVDGIHIDDYFYPYPESNLVFNDEKNFQRDPRGFKNKADWRRDNVNVFIAQLSETVKKTKPWVKFGISPFGIYRNASISYPKGSYTAGFENYSGLYADVLLWIERNWIDYCIPQIYWNVGHPSADYSTLIEWWAENAGDCPIYIGQDVERTVKGVDPLIFGQNQERLKMNMQRSLHSVMGSCQWYAKLVVDNIEDYRTVLKEEYYVYPSLQPLSPSLPKDEPGKVRKIRRVETATGPVLFWTSPKSKGEADTANQYVVYCFEKGETVDIDNPANIVAIVNRTFLPLPTEINGVSRTYVVTALSRVQVESQPVKCKIKF